MIIGKCKGGIISQTYNKKIQEIQHPIISMQINHRQVQSYDQVLSEEQILHLLYQFKQAKTQEQVKIIEQQMRRMIVNGKNFATIISMIIAKDVSLDDKVLMVSIMNFVVEELLKKYQNIRNKMKSKQAHRQIDELRRDVVNISTKMEKIIDCNTVPMHLKPKIIFLLLKLFNRSKEDWDSARVTSKMQYYFRKDLIAIAISYFTNIIKLGFSIRQKLEIIRKVMTFLPNAGAKCFAKIARQTDRNQSLNNDMSSILQQMLNILKTEQSEIRREIIINWSNSEIFMTLIKAIIEQPNNQNNTYNYITKCRQNLEEWRDRLLEIIKKISYLIYFYNVTKQCYNFITFFIQYIRHFWQQAYASCDDRYPERFQEGFGKYVGLFINGTEMRVLPVSLLCPEGNYQVSGSWNNDGSNLGMQDKVYLFRNYILKIYQYYRYKIHELLQTTNKQTQTETLELFAQLCSAQQIDIQSQNFPYSYSVWLLSLVQQYKHIGYYIKNLIYCALFSQNKHNMTNQQWLQQEVAIIDQLNESTEMGMLLSLLLYKSIVLDRNYLQECVGNFILMVVDRCANQSTSIFSRSATSICLFLLLVQNYMQEIPIYTTANMRIKQYKLSEFIKLLITQLSTNTNTNAGNLPMIYLITIKKYIKLLKCLIEQYKQSPTYISYSKKIHFVQLEQPLFQFHQLLTTVPIQYYTELYEEIIDYHLFKIQGEREADTISRVKVVLDNVVTYYQNTIKPLDYGHRIFKMFEGVCNCPEYVQLMGSIFREVNNIITSSKQALQEFEEDAVNLCVMVLKKPHIVAAMGQQTLNVLWGIVYVVLQFYEWKEYTTQAQINFSNSTQYSCYIPESSFTYQQMLLFYLTSNYIIPPQLTILVFKKAKQTLLNITSVLTYKKRNLLLAKYRPFQFQQIAFLLSIHKIIINFCSHLNPDIIEQMLSIFWSNYEYRSEFLDQFNYVNGKYNLIVVLLMRYAWRGLWAVFQNKEEAVVEKIYHEIFYNQISYRVQYDSPLFVLNALPILKRLWAANREVDRFLLKKAHFLVGGCILCLDRIYQNYRCDKEDCMQIQVFKNQVKDPVLETEVKITNFINHLTEGEPFVDEFEEMRQFYRKIIDSQEVFTWFMHTMNIYIKSQVYLEHFYTIFCVMKMKKKNGVVIYRVCKRVKEQFYQELASQAAKERNQHV